MPERRLIAAMEEEIRVRIAQLDAQADEAVRRIEAEADEALRQAQSAEEARTDERFAAYARRGRFRLDALRCLRERDLQLDLAAAILDEVEQGVARAHDRPDYAVVWRRLFDEAMARYREERGDRPVLCVAAADAVLAETQARAVGAIETSPAVCDGVALRSPDGAIHIDNTLASRLRKGREEFQKILSDALREGLSP